MEPEDCDLQVTAFGIRFILEEDIKQLKKLDDSTIILMRLVLNEAKLCPFCHSSINHDLTRSIKFICDYGEQHSTLEDMHKILERLIEINQEVLSECKEEWNHKELFPLVYDYYRIIHGTSVFYNEFVRLLKDSSDSWLSVKLALEQIVAKSRTNNDYSYREMLEQLNDLEAPEGIRFCDNFVTSFVCFSKQTVSFHKNFNKLSQGIEKFKTLVKASCITNASVSSMLATYLCTNKLPEEMKGESSCSMLLRLIRSNLKKNRQRFLAATESYKKELKIHDFYGSAVVLQELRMTMTQFSCLSCESEKEMMIAINKLKKMTSNISVTIEDMQRHAHLYSLDIKEVGNTLNQFIEDSSLQLSEGRFMPSNEEQPFENPVSDSMYQATLSLTLIDLQWYMRTCEEEADDSSFLSCDSIIHDNTSSTINIIRVPWPIGEVGKSLDDIYKVITCLHAINQEGFRVLIEYKEEWMHHPQLLHLVNDYHKICLQISQLYNDFVMLLKGQCDSRLRAILTLKEFGVKRKRDDDYLIYVNEMIFHSNNDERFILSGDFIKSLGYICKQTVGFTRHFKEETHELNSVKVLAKISSGLIAGVFCMMASCMVDPNPIPFKWMEEKILTCVWLHFLTGSFSRKDELFVIKDFLEIDSLLSNVKYKMREFGYPGEEDMMILLKSAEKKILKLSTIIEDMSRHARHNFNHDIIKA